MNIVNLTPHKITLVGEKDGIVARIRPTGKVARVSTVATPVGQVEIDGHQVSIVSTAYGKVEGLPDPEEDTIYVVSTLVVQALGRHRCDVVAPDTGPQSIVRDVQGQIVGVRRFTR